MAAEVFNRYENKYLIDDEKKFARLYSSLSGFTEPDNYNKQNDTYKITNLYYDTDDDYLIRTSLTKPTYKEKLRVRAYGVPDADSTVYVEIKKKVAGLVNKRRSAINLAEAYAFLETGVRPDIESYGNKQVFSEVESMLRRYSVKPVLYLSYDRIAFGETDQDGLRITFDTNILTRRTDLKLEAGSFGDRLSPDVVWLMEVKVKNNMPVWLSRLLSEYKLYPTGFSKYGEEYKKTIAKREKRILYFSLCVPSKNIGIAAAYTGMERSAGYA